MDLASKEPGTSLLRRVFRLGIRQKVVLILFATLLATLTVSGWLALQSQKQDLLRETSIRGADLAQFIAQSLANDVVAYDYHAIESWVNQIARNEDIAHLKVLSAKGNVMAQAGHRPSSGSEPAASFEQEIRVDNEPVGKVILDLATTRIAHGLQRQQSAYIQREAVVILLVLLMVFLAVSYFILRPVARISEVMSGLAPGRGKVATTGGAAPDPAAVAPLTVDTLPLQVGDEIGDLARAFVRLQRRTDTAMEQLTRSERKNRALVEAIPDMMLRLSREGVCLDCKIPRDHPLALDPARLIGSHLLQAVPGEMGNALLDYVNRALTSHQAQLFHHVHQDGGASQNFEVRVTLGTDDEVLVIVRDITEHKHLEEWIRFLAHFDNLTQLPNRALFRERLNGAMAQAHQQGGRLAVILMDLDNFKIVNDTLGHDAGDILLQGVAERLQRCLRTNDYISRPAQDEAGTMVSRPGGDEFTILLTQIADPADAMQAVRRVQETLAAPFRLHGHEISVGASLGIALYPNDGQDAETLIRNADAAMNHAKREGRNGYRFYTQDLNTALSRRLSMEGQLRKALENAELHLHYQPLIAIRRGQIAGVESLLRWQHPERGAVSPAEFIPLAEDTGLILPIGAWVLHEACRQARAWQQQGLPALRVAVNISSLQFRQPGFGACVRKALDESGLAPHYLELELTEGILLRHDDELLNTLRALKDLGVHLSLDDFGTGYSSLSYLKRFPLDTLKIDRSFVTDLPHDPGNTAIASAILAMAQSLMYQVTAEGVENAAQLAFLEQKGCDLAQGYLFSPAVPADQLAALLQQQAAPLNRLRN